MIQTSLLLNKLDDIIKITKNLEMMCDEFNNASRDGQKELNGTFENKEFQGELNKQLNFLKSIYIESRNILLPE